MFSGVGTNNASVGATSQDLQEAQQNQAFWNNVYSQFNPQAPTISAQSSAPAYANIANTAKSMFGNSVSGYGGPTGNLDQNQVGQNLQTTGTAASKTQDINDYMNDIAQNQQSAEQRELSMFGGQQGQNAANTALFQTAPENAMLGQANTQTQEANEWNDYYNNQPNFLNELGEGIGTGVGKIVGAKASNSMFGNAGNEENDNDEDEG